MPLVLDRFRSWNYLLPGLEDAPIITDLFSGHEAKYHTRSPLIASFSKLCLVDAVHPPSTFLQQQRVGTPFPSIQKLPAELIANIFTLCHATEEDDHRHSVTGCARVILSHVCSRWRAVILSMPLVWATISIRGPKDSSLPRFKAHLERSAPCPLSLRLSLLPPTLERTVEHGKEIADLVIAHSQRVKLLRLSIYDPRWHSAFGLVQTAHFPALETLELDLRDWEQGCANAVLGAFSHSLRIQSLLWRGPGGLPSSSFWMTLTNIEICNSLSLREVHTLLTQCREVVELRISRITKGSPLDNEAMVTLHRLESLSVLTQEALDCLFESLCTPRLKKLTLRYHHNTSPHNRTCHAFYSFLARSDCALESLVLRDDRMSSEALDQFLRISKLDTLRDLRIESPVFTDRTFETLTRQVNGDCILPLLESLCFWRSQSTDGTLGRMAMSRSGGRGAHAVCDLIRLQTAVDESRLMDRRALDTLKAQGMSIDYESW
ncbi:hypothetical protein HGRIS_003983 [Hohenbuehelia grisea]|uniref:F-box domain-containing protein n=1 Tax=Hohenbuehelia grisea TaxID=104357 RepID=A0ABR3JHX6_9AGAR